MFIKRKRLVRKVIKGRFHFRGCRNIFVELRLKCANNISASPDNISAPGATDKRGQNILLKLKIFSFWRLFLCLLWELFSSGAYAPRLNKPLRKVILIHEDENDLLWPLSWNIVYCKIGGFYLWSYNIIDEHTTSPNL